MTKFRLTATCDNGYPHTLLFRVDALGYVRFETTPCEEHREKPRGPKAPGLVSRWRHRREVDRLLRGVRPPEPGQP